jgi:hypothetical protein
MSTRTLPSLPLCRPTPPPFICSHSNIPLFPPRLCTGAGGRAVTDRGRISPTKPANPGLTSPTRPARPGLISPARPDLAMHAQLGRQRRAPASPARLSRHISSARLGLAADARLQRRRRRPCRRRRAELSQRRRAPEDGLGLSPTSVSERNDEEERCSLKKATVLARQEKERCPPGSRARARWDALRARP